MKCFALLVVLSAYASALDGKSLVVGIGIGAGMFVTRNYIALPAAKASKKAARKTARAAVHVITLGKK